MYNKCYYITQYPVPGIIRGPLHLASTGRRELRTLYRRLWGVSSHETIQTK